VQQIQAIIIKGIEKDEETENHSSLHKCLQAGGSVKSVVSAANSIVKHSSCSVSNIQCA